MSNISIVNLEIGNIASVKNAFQSLGAQVRLVNSSTELKQPCDAIVLPGVGSFSHAMKKMNEEDYPEALNEIVLENGTPFFGICLGMQLMADEGEEGGITDGLGWIGGKSIRLPSSKEFYIPHMGWDDISIQNKEPLFSELPKLPSFYFVHSYYLAAEPKYVSATCDYGIAFPVAVQNKNILGVQFHPEKSQKNGTQVLSNFLDFIKK